MAAVIGPATGACQPFFFRPKELVVHAQIRGFFSWKNGYPGREQPYCLIDVIESVAFVSGFMYQSLSSTTMI